MDSFAVITLIVLVVLGAFFLLLTWGAYAGKTKLLWHYGAGGMVGGPYWFVLTPALFVGDILVVIAMVLVELNPETAGLFANNPSDPLPASLVIAAIAIFIIAIAASYWLPERWKPHWIREEEAREKEARAARKQARRRGTTTIWPG
jgi:hypothetical protein